MFGRDYSGMAPLKGERMSFTANFGLLIMNGCRDNIGLNPESNVSTESVRGRRPARAGSLLEPRRAH